MKYLVLLLIVVGGIWWIRQQCRPHQAPPQAGPQVMVPCAHCGTHVPQSDAIHGARGMYCSATHRDSHEG